MNLLKKLLTPPIFDDEAKTQQAYMLHFILWTLTAVPVPYLLYSAFVQPEILGRALAQGGFGILTNIVLLIALRRGYVNAASIAQVLAFWLFFTVTALTGPGLQGESYLLGYALVITIAGILLGWRGATAFTILSIAAGAVMLWLQFEGVVGDGHVSTPLTTWLISLILFPVSAVLQWLASRRLRAALARAKASEEQYRLISEVSSDYTFSTLLNHEGKMYLNWVAGAFEQMTGFTFNDYVASGGWQVHLHPDDVEKDNLAFEKLARNQAAVSEVRTRRKDGRIAWVRVYAQPVWNTRENRLKGIVGAVQDINEQKWAEEALRESETIYRKAIEVSGAVPYRQIFDAQGNIHYEFMGEGIRSITGYGPEEFSDELWGTLVQERHLLDALEPFELEEAIKQVRTGNIPIWRCEHLIKARDGQLHWVFEAAVDLRDEHGNAHGSIGMYQDITTRKQAEDMLRYERDLLQTFLDNIPDTVYFKDKESRFVRINRRQAGFLKISRPEDAVGKTDRDFQSPALAEQFMQEERQIIESGQPIVNRIEFNPTEDGESRWLSATKVPVRDARGEIVGLIGISRDVTLQKMAEAREEQRRVLLEKVILLGQKMTEVKDLNTTLEGIWHGVREEIGFDRVAIFLYDQETNTINSTLGTDNNGTMQEEWEYQRTLDRENPTSFVRALEQPNGLYYTSDFGRESNIPEGHEMHNVKDFAAASAWAGDKPVAILTVDNLPSGRSFKGAELEALRLFAGYAGLAIENSRLNQALQQELGQRQTLIDELEKKNAELERFTYTVSHDLKSPLVTITGFLGFLEKDAAGGDIDRVRSSVNRIAGAAKKMQALLNDLLELSRIGRIMNPPEDIPFEEVIHEAIDYVRGALDEADAVVEVQRDLPIIRGDRIRLVEVMQNLIDNAVKYSAPLTRPCIEIGENGFNEKGFPIFFVRDNGIGIEPQYHERIFGLFNKLDAQSQGTGVGLSLVKRIIEVHNGRIWVESEKDKGATFYFSLPTPQKKE